MSDADLPTGSESSAPSSEQAEGSWNPAPLWRNWISLLGLASIAAATFSFLLLFLLDVVAHGSNPYVGVLAYLVAPMFGGLGVFLVLLGIAIQRFLLKRRAPGKLQPLFSIDTSRPKDRGKLAYATVGLVLILLVAAFGSYRSYHFTESVSFCGTACHTVMEPEYTTYLHSPHARVACTECHIGQGAEWWVKAKISGLYQVYATARKIYQTPIETPVKNLRPAQETCEQCHWPQKFVGNMERVYTHYLADEKNTPYTVRLLLKVGGGDPTRGPVGGIHWHMNVANKVEYIATDEKRQVIPWVRVTNAQGMTTEFKSKNFTDDPAKHKIRRMDCMDCHNRPSHIFQSPNEALDIALSLGRLDPTMPNIKTNALECLTPKVAYASVQEAMDKIASGLTAKYPQDQRVKAAIDEVQSIYKLNFFPEMKSSWQVYPVNIGHKEWPGCFRCHDGDHSTADGKQSIKANDCNACHLVLAQGQGGEASIQPKPVEFKHPGGSLDGQKCNECHNDYSVPKVETK